MRYIFNYEELAKLNNTISKIAEPDSATVLELGKRDMGEKIQVVVRITTSAEELKYAIFCDKPEGFAGDVQTVAVKSRVFAGVVSSLASFKEDIAVEVDGGSMKIGNSTALVPMETISAIPQEMNSGSQDPVLMQFQVKGSDLSAFIRRSLETTDPKEVSAGLCNAIVSVDTTTGKLKGASFDSKVLSYGTMKAVMATVPNGVNDEIKAQMEAYYNKMKEDLGTYCKETNQSPEAVRLLFPSASVKHLKSLIADADADGQKEQKDDVYSFGIDKRRVYIFYNNSNTMYTFVQGRDCIDIFAFIANASAAPVIASAQMDQASCLRSVKFLNGAGGLMETDKCLPLKIVIAEGCLNLSAGKDFAIKNIVKVNSSVGAGSSFATSGKFLQERLEALDKGGVCASFVEGGLILSNGTFDNQSEYKTIIGLYNPEAVKQDNADEGDDSGETAGAVETEDSVA